jgi:hypothetical protein
MRTINKLTLLTLAMTALTVLAPLKAKAMPSSSNLDTYIKQTGYYYEQLTPIEKKAYEINAEKIAEYKRGYAYWSEIEEGLRQQFTDEEIAAAHENNIFENITGAWAYDHPVEVRYANATRTELLEDADKMQKTLSKAATIVASVKGKPDHEKVKYFHDYLVNNITYSTSAPNCTTAYGALVGGKCLCQGYDKALRILCNMSGIEAVPQYGLGLGEAHVWTIVKLEDNAWYEIDATWDDAGDNTPPSYQFYLKTKQEMQNMYHEYYETQNTDEMEYYYKKVNPVATGTKFAYKETATPAQTEYNPNGSDDTVFASDDELWEYLRQQNDEQDGTSGKDTGVQNVPTQTAPAQTDNGRCTADTGEEVVLYGKEAVIVKGSGNSIPSTVSCNGRTYEVKEVADGAYENNKELTSITIPASVTKVGKNAFKGCSSLKKVKFAGKNVKKIGKNAFKGIHKKAKIYVPKKVFDKYSKMLKKSKVAKTVKIKKK